MKMTKILKIEYCDSCPYLYGGRICAKMDYKCILDAPNIPEWCPLDEFVRRWNK